MSDQNKERRLPNIYQHIATNPLAVKVKIQDLKDNMDLSRLGGKSHWKMETYKETLIYIEQCLEKTNANKNDNSNLPLLALSLPKTLFEFYSHITKKELCNSLTPLYLALCISIY